MAGACGLRGTWWRSCGYGGAFMAGVSSFGCGDSQNDALKEGNRSALARGFVVDLEMGLNRPCLERLTVPGTLRSAGAAAGPTGHIHRVDTQESHPRQPGLSGKANRERWRLATTTSMSPEHVCGLRILPAC